MTETDAVWSLCGYRPLDMTCLVVTRESITHLFVTPRGESYRASTAVSKECVTSSNNFEMGIKQLLETIPNIKERFGIAGFSSSDRETRRSFLPFLGNAPLDCDDFIQEFGKIRSDSELELASRARMIAERGYEKLIEFLSIGQTEYELAAEISSFMRSLGSSDVFQLLCSSKHNRLLHQPTDRKLEESDVIIAELSPSIGGVFIQGCYTIVLGEGEKASELRKKHELLEQAFEDGLDQARSGNLVSDLARAIDERISKAGYNKYVGRARGHGLGLGSVFPGDVTVANNSVLEDGMMFVLHPNQYFPETGYMLCGDTITIRNGKGRRLSNSPITIGFVNSRK